MTDLSQKTCEPCQGGIAALNAGQCAELLQGLHEDWVLDTANTCLTREFTFKGFAKAVYTANLAAWLADREGHHPDVAFGWGYCRIVFTTHDIGGLSENDFICAAKLDRMVEGG